MKRSQLNGLIQSALNFLEEMRMPLPAFATWKKEDWATKGDEYDEVFTNMLGWDVTDFGTGDFDTTGLLILTLRNGSFTNPEKYPKTYCEKFLIVEDGQCLPMHFHFKKMEDIINRGGGVALIKLYNSDENEALADTPVEVSLDGKKAVLPAGSVVRLEPGQSITLTAGMYHDIVAEKGSGKLLLGEVSTVNDDTLDNRFLDVSGRIPEIEEDCEPLYYIFKDYKEILGK